MQSILHFTTHVMAGSKIEITAPELTEGGVVDIFLVIRHTPSSSAPVRRSVFDIVQSLPPGPRSASTWEQIDRQWNVERDAWD